MKALARPERGTVSIKMLTAVRFTRTCALLRPLKSEVRMGAGKGLHVVWYMRTDVAEETEYMQQSSSVGVLVREAKFCIHIEKIVKLLDLIRLSFR